MNDDPVLRVWRRRRGRDTFVHSATSSTSPELEAAVKQLVTLVQSMGSRTQAQEQRIQDLERMIQDIGRIRRG